MNGIERILAGMVAWLAVSACTPGPTPSRGNPILEDVGFVERDDDSAAEDWEAAEAGDGSVPVQSDTVVTDADVAGDTLAPVEAVCPEVDPNEPKVGEGCSPIGHSRCSTRGMVTYQDPEFVRSDSGELIGQLISKCRQPYRLYCEQGPNGEGVWVEEECQPPPPPCVGYYPALKESSTATCVEYPEGARCCSTRCRSNGSYVPLYGAALCATPDVESCGSYGSVHTQHIYACVHVEESKLPEHFSNCASACEGCRYVLPKSLCPKRKACTPHSVDGDGRCIEEPDGTLGCDDTCFNWSDR